MLRHQSNRLAGYGPLVQVFSNSIHYFEKNTKLQKALNGPMQNDLYFQMIEKSALNYLKATRNPEIDKIKVWLLVQNINSDLRKVYFN